MRGTKEEKNKETWPAGPQEKQRVGVAGEMMGGDKYSANLDYTCTTYLQGDDIKALRGRSHQLISSFDSPPHILDLWRQSAPSSPTIRHSNIHTHDLTDRRKKGGR